MAEAMIVRRGAGAGKSAVLPAFSFTGTYEAKTDAEGYSIVFKTSGTLTLERSVLVDAVLIGGGGGGRQRLTGDNYTWMRGGGSGYNTQAAAVSLKRGTAYEIVIGAGGASNADGGTTEAFGYTAAGGLSGKNGGLGTAKGGCGDSEPAEDGFLLFGDEQLGMVCGAGGSGAYDANGPYAGGAGGGGKGGGPYSLPGANGVDNTGGGGGGGGVNTAVEGPGNTGGTGGSGLVVIRNSR